MMKSNRCLKLSVILVSLILLLSFSTDVALAQTEEPEESEYVELTGEVVSVDTETGMVVLAVKDDQGETVEYTVQLPEGYDTEDIIGETITVVGSFNQDGVFITEATTSETEEDQAGNGMNYFCANPDAVHPVAQGIADTYGVTYQDVMGWFCKAGTYTEGDVVGEGEEPTDEEEPGNNAGTGFGQIILALQTAEATEDTADTADTYLEMRKQGQGWGQIWQELGYRGKPKPEADTEGDGKKVPPGQAKKDGQEKIPPGQAKKEGKENKVPPGQAKSKNKKNK